MEVNTISGRTLAFLGDAVWSLVVREHLIEKGEGKGKTLQKESISFVSAKAQASFYETLYEANFFNEEEEEIFHRGRNSNTGAVPKNTDSNILSMPSLFGNDESSLIVSVSTTFPSTIPPFSTSAS